MTDLAEATLSRALAEGCGALDMRFGNAGIVQLVPSVFAQSFTGGVVVEPSGRLPISFAAHAGQQPTYYNQIRGQHGTRYADLTQGTLVQEGRMLST